MNEDPQPPIGAVQQAQTISTNPPAQQASTQPSNAKLESIKKDIKKIKRGGFNTELLGFLLIIFAGIFVWFSSSFTSAIIRFSVFALLGIFFFYTGTYIKDGWGRKVKFFLILNGFISFFLCMAIIPIYICIQSVNNHSRFKDFPEKIQALYKERKGFKIKKNDLVILGVFILIALVSFGIKEYEVSKTGSKNNTSVNKNQPSVAHLSKYNFTITFPSTPSPTDFTQQINGHTVPYTTYVSYSKNGSQDFDVYAYDWPSQYFNYNAETPAQMSSTIHSSLTSIVQGLKGTIVNDKASTYSGKPSEDAEFSVPTFAKTNSTGYIKVFFVGNKEYAIISVAAKQSDFNNFVNSFKYGS